MYIFGSAIEGELSSMEQRKGESSKAYASRKKQAFQRMLASKSNAPKKFAAPTATM